MLEEKLGKLTAKINSFQINKILDIETNNIKIINGNIYVYVINNSINIYDYKTFREIAILKLPFKRKKPILEILENEIVLIFADSKLYFYKINIKESKLSFLHYLSEIYHFCYLKKRKEIFLLTEMRTDKGPLGMAKSDLLGNIIFTNKIKPKIHYEFIAPNTIDQKDYMVTHVQSSNEDFSEFHGFNDDKYIINISGYIYDWYDYKIQWGDTEITIYNADNLNELLHENHYEDLKYLKITDNLFKFINQSGSFYYDEKNNKIQIINNLFNYISKCFSLCNEKKDKKNKKNKQYKQYENNEYYKNSEDDNSQNFKYFYLNDNMFAVFDRDSYLYIINMSLKNNIVRKIKLNWIRDKYISPDINNINYCKLDKNEYLFISFKAEDKNTKSIINKIIHGIIL